MVLDPITNLVSAGLLTEVNSMLLRLIDVLQGQGITVMLTALMSVTDEKMDEGVSSLVDTWISIREVEANGERNKSLYIMKSRGMKHSNQVREFMITDNGLKLVEVYLGPNGILVGSAREEQELQRLTGGELEAQQNRKLIARRRQEDGIPNKPKQRAGK